MCLVFSEPRTSPGACLVCDGADGSLCHSLLPLNLADYLIVDAQHPAQQWIAAVVQAPEVSWAASPFASETQRAAFEDDGDACVRGGEPTARACALARARSWCAATYG